uniref:Uncharacterized protein n=1 Tax=Glossina austeni TaxID=7395 RepID=A0A1A9UUF8_GLOAU
MQSWIQENMSRHYAAKRKAETEFVWYHIQNPHQVRNKQFDVISSSESYIHLVWLVGRKKKKKRKDRNQFFITQPQKFNSTYAATSPRPPLGPVALASMTKPHHRYVHTSASEQFSQLRDNKLHHQTQIDGGGKLHQPAQFNLKENHKLLDKRVFSKNKCLQKTKEFLNEFENNISLSDIN